MSGHRRRRGEELQRAFDEVRAACLAVPERLCMVCRRPRKLHTIHAIFGDVATEMETGKLEINGAFGLRICRPCYENLKAYQRARGLPVREAWETQ